MAASSHSVFVDDEQDVPLEADRWAALARSVLQAEGVPANAEVSIFFVDEAEIAALNEQYMGEVGATDVLSFPIDGEDLDAADHRAPADGDVPMLLGDVIVCPAVAARNAPEHPGTHAPIHTGSFDDELALLVVHGVLHLLGYDHAEPDEAAAMQARERDLLAAHYRKQR
jgi:probable rRNA maturation factor